MRPPTTRDRHLPPYHQGRSSALRRRFTPSPRHVLTAEREITIAMPQVRGSLPRFVSSVLPDTGGIVRRRPFEALVIGVDLRGLDRDIEGLAWEAGPG